MKKTINFKGGIRGKYAGKTIEIIGAVDDLPEPLVVKIDDDLALVFKTPEAVNKILRDSLQKKRRIGSANAEKIAA